MLFGEASEAVAETGAEDASQRGLRHKEVVFEVSPRSLTKGLMNGVIAHGLAIFDRLNLAPVSRQVSHFNMLGIKPRPLELLRDVEEIGEKGELNRDTLLTQIWYAIQTIDTLAQGAIELPPDQRFTLAQRILGSSSANKVGAVFHSTGITPSWNSASSTSTSKPDSGTHRNPRHPTRQHGL